jgi:hypothetical protein
MLLNGRVEKQCILSQACIARRNIGMLLCEGMCSSAGVLP